MAEEESKLAELALIGLDSIYWPYQYLLKPTELTSSDSSPSYIIIL